MTRASSDSFSRARRAPNRALAPLLAAVALGFAPSAAPARGAGAGGGPGASGADLSQIRGTWKLDWERSDALDPLMRALEVPWAFRQLAGLVGVSLEIEGEADGVRLTTRSAVRTIRDRGVLDGRFRDATDPFGRAIRERYRWSEPGRLVIGREVPLSDGEIARVEETLEVADDGALVATLTVHRSGGAPLRVRRVYARAP